MATESIRCFVGIDIPSEARKEVAQLLETCRTFDLPIQWNIPENVHLTLKFIGNISPELVDKSCLWLESFANTLKPFEMRLESIGVFPNWMKPRVLWIGSEEGSQTFSRIGQGIDEGLGNLGVKKNNHLVTPHLTLGRIKVFKKMGGDLQRLRNLSFKSEHAFAVNAFKLFRGPITKDRPVYEIMNTFSLQAS